MFKIAEMHFLTMHGEEALFNMFLLDSIVVLKLSTCRIAVLYGTGVCWSVVAQCR